MLDSIVTQPPATPTPLGADGKPLYPELSEVDRQIHEWQSNSPFYVAPPNDGRGKHIVDALIEERTPKLSSSRFWPLFRGGVYKVLGYRKVLMPLKRWVCDLSRPAQNIYQKRVPVFW